MGGSIEIPFEIGEEVWWAGHGSRIEDVVCPECVGTRFITMTNGAGEVFKLDCAACRTGYETSRGTIQRTFYEHAPVRFVCRRVDISGREVRYSESSPSASCYSMVEAKNLYRDLEECRKACERLNVERQKNLDETYINNLKSKRRDMAWSVHYWGGQVRKLRDELKRAEDRLDVCKAKERAKAESAKA